MFIDNNTSSEFFNQNNAKSVKNISPLRYPGGKTRACKTLDLNLCQHFNVFDFENIVSPFFGGGSFEFYLQNKYGYGIIANDKFAPLHNFWSICKIQPNELCSALHEIRENLDKDKFLEFRKSIMAEHDELKKALMYFSINRCSFSGSTLSGGFSQESSKKRFTSSSISRIEKLNLERFEISNLDFEEFINQNIGEKNLIFLDPPYYLEKKSRLYGKDGDMHEHFNHDKLYDCISTKKNWLMTYNDCSYIRKKYADFKILEAAWSYGMNKSKTSSEIIIIG